MKPRLDPLVSIIVAVSIIAIMALITLVVLDGTDEPDKPKDRDTITFKVDGPDKDLKPDDLVKAGGAAPDVLDAVQAAPEKFDIGDNLRGDDTTPEGEVSLPLATPSWPGCKTRFTPVNFSNRTNTIKGFGFHYTGSRNIAGWADMNGLAAYASSRAAGVSWHFLIDREGHCYYQVPTGKKAWTIGNLNSETINVEMIGNGGEGDYGGTAGFNRLRAIVRRAGSIYNFPVRLGAASNCRITRKGIITHWMGGSCAGGHSDIRPFDLKAIVRRMGTSRASSLRNRNNATHKSLRDRRCAASKLTRSEACKTLHRRHAAIHAAAKREKISL